MRSAESTLVSCLIQEMDKCSLQYAILRNYENYPSFGNDLDMVVDKRDVPKWREIAVKTASQEGWDNVTECHHWSDQTLDHLNIEVFRF